ncbi:hypothetical protein ACH5RR_001156 [Cinchona calisaya]|uniref:Uncharacterized protein n=1 Tax=Cinchona calisaya TaxID=153742 RepID=A0ABD3B2N2_9GENT
MLVPMITIVDGALVKFEEKSLSLWGVTCENIFDVMRVFNRGVRDDIGSVDGVMSAINRRASYSRTQVHLTSCLTYLARIPSLYSYLSRVKIHHCRISLTMTKVVTELEGKGEDESSNDEINPTPYKKKCNNATPYKKKGKEKPPPPKNVDEVYS